jgi:hypothetical protein
MSQTVSTHKPAFTKPARMASKGVLIARPKLASSEISPAKALLTCGDALETPSTPPSGVMAVGSHAILGYTCC